MALIESSILAMTNNAMSITMPSDLNRPVELLSEHIQKGAREFYDVHGLLIRKKSFKVLEAFIKSKAAIKSEFDTIHQVLQSSYRHIIDFTGSCKRAPDERAISAQRCHRSGKAILREIQDVMRTFDAMAESFRLQKPVLSVIWASDRKHAAKKGGSSSQEEIPHIYPLPEDSVALLYDALDNICSSLKDLFIFWDGHVSFLTLVLNRQTNSPYPGEETRQTVQLWTEYQRIILKANSSISKSIETMILEPVITSLATSRPRQLPWRRHTYPQTKLRREPTIIESTPKPASQWQEYATCLPADVSLSGRLTGFIRKLF